MAQNPLPPPPPSGGVLDGWLYMLWRRLTQAGQILWESITPGTSADVAAVVTDETGSPGSLVFSGNPTLAGATVTGAPLAVGSAPVGTIPLSVYSATSSVIFLHGDSTVGQTIQRSSGDAAGAFLTMKKTRGTYASPAAVSSGDSLFTIAGNAYGGTTTGTLAYIAMNVETYTADTNMSGYLRILTRPDGAGAAAVENFRISGNGTVTIGGVNTAPAIKVIPVASQARWIEVTGATSSANPTIGVSGGILAISSSVAITGVVSTSGYTVATLPAGTVGQRAYVTDALAPAYGVAVAGGGAVTIPVFYNGAAWICA